MSTKERPNLTLKVISGFGILSAILILVIYLSYINFSRLLASVQILAEPEKNEEILRNISEDISSSMRIIRLYALKGDDKYYQDYLERSSEIKDQLNEVKEKSLFSNYREKLDSLEFLIGLKDSSAASLRRLVKARENNISSLNEIKLVTDTVYLPVISVETTRIKKKQLLVGDSSKPDKNKKTSFLSKVFSSKNQDDKQVEVEQELIYDTTLEVRATTYSNVEGIKKQLDKWEDDNRMLDNVISKEENDLLENNGAISNLVKQILTDLKKKELKEKKLRLSDAARVIRHSTYIILIIGVSGLAGCFVFFVLISKDIRLSNLYRNKLTREKRKAEKLAKIKEQFLSNMSHEIRTPLGVIIGFSEQLDRSFLLPEQKEQVSAIRKSSNHLLALVNDILDLSKMQAGKMSIEKVEFNLEELLKDVYLGLRMIAEEKKLDFSYQIESELLEKEFKGDPLRIKQVLFNIIGNAIKFTEEKGSVRILVSKQVEQDKTDRIRISVIDTGIGIPTEKQSLVFKNFEQVNDSDSRKFGGTGLGLAIVKQLVTLMNGEVSLESEPGKGTTFTIDLPLSEATNSIRKTMDNPEMPVSFPEKSRVLVAEDDPFLLELFKIIFARYKIQGLFVSNGNRALAEYKKQDFDLVITDMQMPDFSGEDLIRAIRQEPSVGKREIPIILCTANVNDSVKIADHENLTFLLKPFQEKQLLQVISLALNRVHPSEFKNLGDIKAEKSEKLYNLKTIKELVDNEDEFRDFIKVIVDTGRTSIGQINEHTASRNYQQIAEIAHKLIPTYIQIGAFSIVDLLKTMEVGIEEEEKLLNTNIALTFQLDKLLTSLEEEVLKPVGD